MGCPCSAILNSTRNANANQKLLRHINNSEIVKLRNYIQNHPNKDSPLFKESMKVILLQILKGLN